MPIKADAQHARWSFNEAHCNWGGALGAVRPRAKAIVAIMAGSCTCPQLRGGAMSRNLHEHLEVSDPAPIRLALEHPVVLDHGAEVLHARAHELQPLVPRDFLS